MASKTSLGVELLVEISLGKHNLAQQPKQLLLRTKALQVVRDLSLGSWTLSDRLNLSSRICRFGIHV
jgi:hypothetical protein